MDDTTTGTMTTTVAPLTVGNVSVWPNGDNWYYPYGQYPYGLGNYYWHTVTPVVPTQCSGEVHVFPCPHCDKCKCGGATKARKGK